MSEYVLEIKNIRKEFPGVVALDVYKREVEPLRHMQADTRQIIAIDNIGAGIGEYVIVAQGSAARIGCDMEEAPVDAAIVGIIDDGGILEKDDAGME